jgi:hypothetical protein
VSTVNTTNTAIIEDAGVRVYDHTGSLVTEEIIIDKGTYTNIAAVYDITFSVKNDLTTNKKIKANVILGEVPVISGATFTEIAINESFDPLSGVSASDTEDGNLSDKIVVSGSVDITKAGIYILTYKVSDIDTNITEQSRVVLVNDGNYFAGTNFIIHATDFSLRVGEVNTEDADIKTRANI